jgi:putative transposase
MIRRRITAYGVQPVVTVTHKFANFSLYGAVEPTTREHCCLELPHLNSLTFQRWVDGFGDAFSASYNIVVLDNGAFHKATAVQWPSHGVPLFLLPYSPELNPMERVWRDRKDKLADVVSQTLEELSEAVCVIMQSYSDAILQALTGFAYFVQAVETARKAYV